MNKINAFIPNLLTLGNLFCGVLAIYLLLTTDFSIRAFTITVGLIFTSLVLDFFDGFVARLLKVSSELGTQLDSLADVVSFGVFPALLVLTVLNHSQSNEYLPFVGLLIVLGACYRLAKFNIDTEQTTYFKGLATPAMTLFVIGLTAFYLKAGETQFQLVTLLFVVASLVLPFLMNVTMPLFSLKVKNISFANNWYRYVLLVVSLCLSIWLGLSAFAIIIPLYILLSIVVKKQIVR